MSHFFEFERPIFGSWIVSIKRYVRDVQNQVSEVTNEVTEIDDEKNMSGNVNSFNKGYKILENSGAFLIFPEGT